MTQTTLAPVPDRQPTEPLLTTLDSGPRFPDSLLISAPFRRRGETLGGTPRLPRAQLVAAQQETLDTPRRRYSLAASALFLVMDLVYGRSRTLPKFQAMETVARIPYQSLENVAYRRLSRNRRQTGVARRIHQRIIETREHQDNKLWHLLIVEDMVQTQGVATGRFRFGFLPWLMAVAFYHLSWLLHAVNPRWSHRLNSDFADYAEHEYAMYVAEHPELEHTAHDSQFAEDYGSFASAADLFRQIGYDERMHKIESESARYYPRPS